MSEPPRGEEIEFSPIRGGPLYEAERAVGLIPRHHLGVGRRAILLALVTWLPIAAWAWWQGRVLGGAEEPLLRHFGVPIRCLVAIPLLVLAEPLLERVAREKLLYAVRSGLVPPASVPALREAARSAMRLRDSRLAFAILLGVLAVAAAVEVAGFRHLDGVSWALVEEGGEPELGFGGWWVIVVLQPVYRILVASWLWRVVVCASLLWRIARLDLALAPTHPDRAAGLGFLERFAQAFALPALALSAVFASRLGHEILYHGAHVRSLVPVMGVFVVLLLVIFLAPLLVFVPRLLALKRTALLDYGALVQRHAGGVHRKWILGEPPEDEAVLEAPELGPVADVEALYAAVRAIRPAPIGRAAVLQIALPALLPLLPVIAIEIPLKEILLKVLSSLT